MPHPEYRVLAVALIALTATLGAADAGIAKKKAPKPPSATVVKKTLKKAYCVPDKNARSEEVDTVEIAVRSVKRGKPRYGRYFYDGVPPNTKTWVFPIKAAYSCTYTMKPGYTGDGKLVEFTGTYSFFKDEFGAWTHKNSNHDYKITRIPS
jgi:hypothetical protein